MSLRREQLLGYLLGALERAEQEQVELELASNPRLREELAELHAALEKVGMNDPPEPVEPPAGLVQRTCDFVACQDADRVSLPPERCVAATTRPYTLADVLVAASVLVMLCALLFPSLARSRFLARLTTCQNNLRQVGLAMWQDSELRPDRTYSRVPWENDRAVAGMMAPLLVERQLIVNPDVFVCPTSELSALVPGFQVPTIHQVTLAPGQDVKRLQKTVGGSLGYPMGYVHDGKVVSRRNAYRENYCLVGEAPIADRSGIYQASHDGLGGNFFFEDGHIRWIEGTGYCLLLDDPYRNRHGQAAAGLDRDDAVLGASDMHAMPVGLPAADY